jgi:carbonic anhydrase
MSDIFETFFTSVGCMDGRVQNPIEEYGQKRYKVLYADIITEAGLVGFLANDTSQEYLDLIKNKILISVEKHHSKGIIVHGHEDCAGDPVDDETQRAQTKQSAEIIKSFVPAGLEVKPVFVVKNENEWVVEEL